MRSPGPGRSWPAAPPRPRPASASSPAPKASPSSAAARRRHPRHPGRLPPLVLSSEVNFNLGPEAPGEPGVPVTDGDLQRPRRSNCRRAWSKTPLGRPSAPRPSSTPPRAIALRRQASRARAAPTRARSASLTLRSSYGGGADAHLRPLQPRPAAGRALGARLQPLRRADRLRPPGPPGRRRIRPYPATCATSPSCSTSTA